MIKNYLTIAWRNLLKNLGYTAINIVGLAIGVCCFILISLYVKNEFSYDRFHTKADRIYRVWQYENYGPREDFANTTTPVSMVRVLKENVPEIEEGSRVYRFNAMVKRSDNEFNEAIHAVDPAFFNVFDFKLLEGNPTMPLTGSDAIVLSERARSKYFGNEDPLGKNIRLKINDELRNYEVTGVMANPPQESSIQFDFLVSIENEALFFGEAARRSWFNVVVESYVLLKPGLSAAQVEAKFPSVIRNYLGSNYEEGTFFLHLQPLTDIHLDPSLPPGLESVSDPKYSYIMATIGLLVLLLACINYVTLAVGRSFSRAIEVGVRKALGAYRKQIVIQFWGEALLITVFAVCLGVGFSYLFLGRFNALTGKELQWTMDGAFWMICTGLVIFIALIAGFYPSVLLSKFNPDEVLRGRQGMGASMGLLGKGLVVAQFVASIVMIISTLVVGRQVDFLMNKELGYQKDAIVVVPTHRSGAEAREFAEVYMDEIKKEPPILGACVSNFSFVEDSWYQVGFTDQTNTYREFAFNGIDSEFLKTYHIPLVSGRDFRKGDKSDEQNGVVVNETFVKQFGLDNPVGKVYDKFGVTILGVMKDFNFQSLNYTIKPLMLAVNTDPVLSRADNLEAQYIDQPRISVRLNQGEMAGNIEILKKTWDRLSPSEEFEYTFLDESLAAQYQSEIRSRSIINTASILAILIACMGLFGLATLNVARRTAEIGIRKVMGAGTWNIIGMISKGFIRLALIAALVAFPLAWWGMHRWLENFAYGISVSWWVFALAATITVLITLLSVGYQAIRAARANPVKSLRTE